MRSAAWISIVSGMALAGCGASRPTMSTPSIVATPRAATDRIDVAVSNGGTVVLDVYSPSGIGSATLALAEEPLTAMRFRFHLQALEELRVEYDSTAVRVAMPSTAPYEGRCTVSVPGGSDAVAIERGDPRYMEVRILPAPGAPTEIPLQDGVIEVDGPLELLRGGATTATFHWVDFYR